MMFRPCAVVPVFNHPDFLKELTSLLRQQQLAIIFVDDGSDQPTRDVLAQVNKTPQVECLTLAHNRGKGAAVIAGFERAAARGFTHALQVDADGQHDLADAPTLLSLAQAHPDHLISGTPRYDDSIPALRFYGRYITHALIWLDTLSLNLSDTMCGFRVYPLAASLALARRVRIGSHMDFDTDIMTRLYWAGTESLFVPTKVHYPAHGHSNFRLFKDNVRMAWLHLRLFAGLWPRIPALLRRRRRQQRATTHWADIAERGSVIGIRFVGWVDRVCGRRFCRALLAPVVVYFMVTHTQARRASRAFLATAGVRPTFTNCFLQVMNFAVSILDKVRGWLTPESLDVDVSACEPLFDEVQAGRGVLLVTAHLGNVEVSRALALRYPQLHINALVHTHNSTIANAMLRRANDDYDTHLLQVTEVGSDTALVLKNKIDAGEIVVIAGDRMPVDANSRFAYVDFMGRRAAFATGPYALAHVLECPVYLFLCIKEKRGYKVVVEPLAERIRLSRGKRSEEAAKWTARFAQRLSHYARRYPLQWYNFYDIWASRKPEDSMASEQGHGRKIV